MTSIPRRLIGACFLASAALSFGQAGSLDPSFDGDGQLTVDVAGNYEYGEAVVVQPDGRILVAGQTSNATWDIVLLRFNNDGSPDLTFSGDGLVVIDLFGYDDAVGSLALAPDGKIIMAGRSNNGTMDGSVVWRFHADGSPDLSFGGSGHVVSYVGTVSTSAQGLCLQPDGKILVAGSAWVSSHFVFALFRYNADGTYDTSFNFDGKVTTDLDVQIASASSIALKEDGRIVAGGWAYDDPGSDFAVVCYDPYGAPDATFGGGDGIVTTTIPDGENAEVWGTAVQPDGRIVVMGRAQGNGMSAFTAARYEQDGTLDPTFGAAGIAAVQVSGYTTDEGRAGVLLADGKILICGNSGPWSAGDMTVVRLLPDGTLDASFGTTGVVTTDVGGDDAGFGLAVQPDNRIVVAGRANGQLAVVRYFHAFVDAVPEHHGIDGFHVHASPASDLLYIYAAERLADVTVRDMSGRLLDHRVPIGMSTILDLTPLPVGIHLVWVRAMDGSVAVHRCVKE